MVIYVLNEYKYKGIGKALIRVCEKECAHDNRMIRSDTVFLLMSAFLT